MMESNLNVKFNGFIQTAPSNIFLKYLCKIRYNEIIKVKIWRPNKF